MTPDHTGLRLCAADLTPDHIGLRLCAADLTPDHTGLRLSVVPGRVELPTSTLSVWRSNQLSYGTVQLRPRFSPRPGTLHNIIFQMTGKIRSAGHKGLQTIPSDSRKEVFQPHLPVRLPCYDLAPVTCFTLGRPSRQRTSGTPGSHGLTGGVYKARERIHRAMADARLLANPASRSWRFASRHRVATLCTAHCNTCVAPDVRAVLI